MSANMATEERMSRRMKWLEDTAWAKADMRVNAASRAAVCTAKMMRSTAWARTREVVARQAGDGGDDKRTGGGTVSTRHAPEA